jgi:hypothetical protein
MGFEPFFYENCNILIEIIKKQDKIKTYNDLLISQLHSLIKVPLQIYSCFL